MFVYDEHGSIVHAPDLTMGRIEIEEAPVCHRWVVDAEEQSHVEIVNTFPNGGVETELVIDVEESGHWETIDERGEIVEFDGVIPDDAPRESVIFGTIEKSVYRKYTDDELFAIEEAKKEAEKLAAKKAADDKFIGEAPDRLATTEAACAESGVAIADLMNAVAELGAIVAGSMEGR